VQVQIANSELVVGGLSDCPDMSSPAVVDEHVDAIRKVKRLLTQRWSWRTSVTQEEIRVARYRVQQSSASRSRSIA